MKAIVSLVGVVAAPVVMMAAALVMVPLAFTQQWGLKKTKK